MEGREQTRKRPAGNVRASGSFKHQESLGRVQPHNSELEEAVLGALMKEKGAIMEVIDIIKPEAFYHEKHSLIMDAIMELYQESEPIDILTVTQKLRHQGKLEIVGGSFKIAQISDKVNSAANIVYHAYILLQYAIRRQLIHVSGEVDRDAYDETMDVFDLLEKSQQSLFEISDMHIQKNFTDIRNVMTEALAELEEKKNQTDGLTGVPTGFSDLDRITSGWQKSDLIIIAARPGMGKTAFSLSAIRNASVDFSKPTAIFSLEMSAVQLVNRLISAEAELESEKLRTGKLAAYEWEQLVHKTSKLAEAQIFIDDTPAISVTELRTKCRKLKAQHGIELVVIDYLQLMTGDSRKNSGNREQEIAHISRSLKQMAKELSIPVIALAQLSRAVETRGGDKRPQLSDLRESGSIEQDADMVMFLYRPEYYGITEDENGNPTTGIGEVIIQKNRHGGLENVQLKFIGKFTKFTDLNAGFYDGGTEDNNFGGMSGADDFMPGGFGNGSPTGGADFDGSFSGGGNSITLGSKMNNPEDEDESFDPRPPEDDDPPF